jgi:hypothetical protein
MRNPPNIGQNINLQACLGYKICVFYALITQFKKDLTVFCMIWSAFADKENFPTFPSIPWRI